MWESGKIWVLESGFTNFQYPPRLRSVDWPQPCEVERCYVCRPPQVSGAREGPRHLRHSDTPSAHADERASADGERRFPQARRCDVFDWHSEYLCVPKKQ
jgi:hypothetical protein